MDIGAEDFTDEVKNSDGTALMQTGENWRRDQSPWLGKKSETQQSGCSVRKVFCVDADVSPRMIAGIRAKRKERQMLNPPCMWGISSG